MSNSSALFAHGATDIGPGAFAPGAIAVGVVVRAAEVLLAAGPYLLAGAVVAAVMRGMLGGAALRSAFGPGRWGGFRAALVGLCLPLCALGVLPVVSELRRAGVPLGSTIAFALSAAVVNPLSLAYGLTLLEPLFLAGIVLAQLVVAVGIGTLVGRGARGADEGPEPVPTTAGRRLALTALTFARAWTGAPAACLLVGVLGAGFVAGVLPPGLLASSMTRQNPFAPAAMVLVAFPAYATPLTGMMQAGTLVRDGFSAGAAWIVLALGVGVNLGTIAWFGRSYGRTLAGQLVVALLGVDLAIGYAAHAFLPSPVTPPDHTHSLDDYTRPASASAGSNQSGSALAGLHARFTGLDALPLAVLVASSLCGAVLQQLGVKVGSGTPRATEEGTAQKPFWNRPIPARWVRLIATAGGVLVAVRLLYVLYPPPADLFEDMIAVRTDLAGPMRPQDRDANLDHIRRLQELVRKLPVAEVIRRGRLAPEQRARTDELADSLEALRESVAAGRRAEAIALLRYVKDTYEACRAAYKPASAFRP